ncbi:branched-chain amino acid ABC transporter permease [Piscinibacter sp.]|uniref:branched-chain amino acid ABC transporter permease n=1 Tax=Piscinibacter sp. TaxID=1903157 RepID=UPI002C9FE994|nr:branched-chain amino acid ABC transporter permease [Albitalea sp.]HUG26073.1 branched-chain amino acid ABC transporter permease [Albitalea sp.]
MSHSHTGSSTLAGAGRPMSRLPIALAAAIVLVALAALPAYAGFATQRLLVEVFTVLAIATAWNLLAGFGGLVAVGQHVFVGVGAYALFVISNGWGLNPWWTLPMAAAVSALFALLTAGPMFRLSGAHFAVGTWVLAELVRIAVLNSEPLGAGGGLPLESLREFGRAQRNAGVYWAALAVAALALLAARLLIKSRLGLALASVRDSEAAARASGVSVKRAKLALWIVAATLTGLAGAVAYMNTLQVSPDASFGLGWTATAIFISVLGGIGRIEGPVIGTFVFFALRETSSQFGAWYFVALGLLAIATMLVAPGGAWSLLQRRWPNFDPFATRRWMP